MTITRLFLSLFLVATVSLVGGCAYKIEIQQGNQELLEKIDQVKVEMGKEEVTRLLGPPQTGNLFNENVWLYVYQLRESGFIGSTQLLSVEMVFDENGKLGDINVLSNYYKEESEE